MYIFATKERVFVKGSYQTACMRIALKDPMHYRSIFTKIQRELGYFENDVEITDRK